MEALSVDEIPTGSGWQYEPKWDGFRCLVFCNGGPLTHLPLRERRRKLEAFARRYLRDKTRIRLSPATTRPSEAKAWVLSR
jgi:ATP-dependent DNA ligase